MGFDKVDLFDVEIEVFESQLQQIALPLFEATDQNLTNWLKKVDDDFRAAIAEAKDEVDERNARGEAAYRETNVDEQRQLLGAACLGFVATSVKECLSAMARYFDVSHPPCRDYVGRGWVQRRQDEFRVRFNIDFAEGPIPIGYLEELVLARNAGLHWDGSALEEYRRRVAVPRFIKEGSLTVDRDSFLQATSDVVNFVKWVHVELKKLRLKPDRKED